MTTRTRTHQVRSPLPGRVRLSGWHKLTLDEVAEIRRLAAARGGWRRAVFACWAVRRHGFNHPRDRVAAQLAPAQIGRASCRERVWLWGVAVSLKIEEH